MKIQLTFLMAEDIPVNAENMEIFQQLNYSVIFEDYKRLRNRLQKYEDVGLKQAS